MRTKHLLLFFAVLVTGGFTALNTVTSDGDQEFASSKTATDKIESVMPQKAAKGFEFDPLQLKDIRTELVNALAGSSAPTLNWLQVGPINVGGRTRALIIDRNEPNILYAGSVSGGVYKSETNGQYWEPVETNFNASVLSVTSLAQAEDGSVYYTTGDIFDTLLVTKQGVSSFAGAGLFKKAADSDVFEHVASTNPIDNEAFFGVTDIAIASNQQMYLSTWKGLYYTADGGGSFSLVTSVPETYITDVKANSNGDIITATEGEVYKGSVGGSFVKVSGTAEGNIEAGGRRYEFAFAPSDPNYLYAIAATHKDTANSIRAGILMGVYSSTDAGSTWEKIGLGGSDEFRVLTRSYTTAQGDEIYEPQGGIGSMMILVDKDDPEYVYVGGVDLWAGYKPEGLTQFQWSRKTYNNLVKYAQLYLTANIHVMVQHPENEKAYIGCDGGIFRYEEGVGGGTVALNNYYSTGQFYDVSYGPHGEYLAGAQDNGVFYNDFSGPGSQTLFAHEIIKDEDFDAVEFVESGLNTLISQLSPQIIFYNHGNKFYRRALDYGETPGSFYTDLMDKQVSGWGNTWSYPFDVYETNNWTITYDINEFKFYDTVFATPENPVDTIIPSQNVHGAPIEYTITNLIMPDSVMPFHDPYKGFFAIGIEGNIWMSNNGTSTFPGDSLDWVPPFVGTKYYDTVTDPAQFIVNNVVLSDDGANMYFSLHSFLEDDNTKTEIFRMDSLYKLLHTDLYYPSGGRIYPTDEMWDNLQLLGEISNTEITSIILDHNDPSKLVITAADYMVNDKVYYCDNANTTTSDDFATNFSSIQGDLPRVPVFDGLINISASAPNQLMLGTEVGVWVTDDYTVASPTWRYDSKAAVGNMGPVPVMAIKQQVHHPDNFPLVENFGVIYVATWGNGIFVDSTYYEANAKDMITDDDKITSAKSGVSIQVYPNPVQDQFKVKFKLSHEGNATLRIYDLTGKLVVQENMGSYTSGSHVYEVNSSEFDMGIYFVEVMSGSQKDAMRIIKR